MNGDLIEFESKYTIYVVQQKQESNCQLKN